MKIHALAALAFITASGVVAQEVENPCVICPNDALLGMDDLAPYADEGDPITCTELIEASKLFETGTFWCSFYEFQGSICCPPVTQPHDPCTICSNGVTVTDDIATSLGCADYIEGLLQFESESDVCTIQGKYYESSCCPVAAENPCVICPDGASAGDDFAPYADAGDLRTCKDFIELYTTFDAGSELCSMGKIEEHYCCPNATASENPGAITGEILLKSG
jgi:hypothetical protein